MALSFFINRKRTTCVISFTGSLTPNDNDVLDACLKEATQEPAKYYILNLGGLKEAEPEVSRPFTLFQQELRSRSKIYLCELQSEAGRVLKAEGVVREGETLPDLMSCLQAILNIEK